MLITFNSFSMLYSLACYVPLVKSLKKCDHYVAEAFLTQSNINAKQWTYLCQNGGHRAFGNSIRYLSIK